MALFKCKMCGGDLEISKGTFVAECEYCGTKQTVPKCTDENIQNIFNRATALRLKNEFDKAEGIYEKIIQSDPTQAEAYWGLLLCRYGIEYVDDPKTFKKIPTCHRTSYESILKDGDYKLAMTHADVTQRSVYAEQAVEIDRIQKDILALAKKEEAYDVFICYKETDENGQRTVDSVIANDIYYQLTQCGYKVFYAAITLEGKLGNAYEPIIFAALNSAKVMLVIGTKPSHFNAVWVKNEWSRYLRLARGDRSRLLIPCYRDMDAYELPDEFSHLQAQDMSKIGFINDIVRGIQKVISNKATAQMPLVREAVVTTAPASVAPLIRRAFLFLEDGDWTSANEYGEKVLDQDPENAEAYLAKLMADLKIKKQDELKNCIQPFNNNNNYQKIIRFANDELKATVEGYIEHINTRNENLRSESIYNNALNAMKIANTHKDYARVAELFSTIEKYKDAKALGDQCAEKAKTVKQDSILSLAKEYIGYGDSDSLKEAITLLVSIRGWKDSEELIAQCQNELERLKKNAKITKIIVLAVLGIGSIIAIGIVLFGLLISAISGIFSDIAMDKSDLLSGVNIISETVITDKAESLYLSDDAKSTAQLLSDKNIEDPGYYEVSVGEYKEAVNKGLTDIVIPNGVTSI